MNKTFSPKVVTANHLLDGDVIYLANDDTWVRHLSDAALITDETVANTKLALAATQTATLVGAYLMDAAPGPKPTHFREEFRATGPSNYDHGKQEMTHV